MPSRSGVLAGTRVLDLTTRAAGWAATKILADLGADVIAVEQPRTDGGRAMGERDRQVYGRNKRSIALDLSAEQGRAVLDRLLITSDAVVQSLPLPSAAEITATSHEHLVETNPKIIHARLSPFGLQGPKAGRGGSDGTIQAESGMAMLQGGVLGSVGFIEACAGLALSQAIIAALLQRERTGRAEHVDVSLLDTAVYLQSAPIAEFSARGIFIDQTAYRIRYPTVGVYQASDGPFYVSPYWERDWIALCAIIDPDLLADPRFCDRCARAGNRAELQQVLQAAFAAAPRQHWVGALEARNVLAGYVRDYADLLTDSQLAANGTFFDGASTGEPRVRLAVAPFRFAGRPLAEYRPEPEVRADTAAVLGELGVDEHEVV